MRIPQKSNYQTIKSESSQIGILGHQSEAFEAPIISTQINEEIIKADLEYNKTTTNIKVKKKKKKKLVNAKLEEKRMSSQLDQLQ